MSEMFRSFALKPILWNILESLTESKDISAGGLCWCWEVIFCAHVISEIRTLASDRCLDHVCAELVHYVGISVDVSGTFTLIQTSNMLLLVKQEADIDRPRAWEYPVFITAALVDGGVLRWWMRPLLFAWVMSWRNRKTRTRHKCSEAHWPWWPFPCPADKEILG